MYIERLTGNVIEIGSEGVTLDVNGVGYGMQVPLSLLCEISTQETRTFFVETYVRENIIKLFGFRSAVELEVFRILISVNGVGPKVGLAILSSLSPHRVYDALTSEDVGMLSQVPGIGPRSAEKILVSLRSKSEKIAGLLGAHAADPASKSTLNMAFPSDSDSERQGGEAKVSIIRDVKSALENLGYKTSVATQKVDLVLKSNPEKGQDFQELMRATLAQFRDNVY